LLFDLQGVLEGPRRNQIAEIPRWGLLDGEVALNDSTYAGYTQNAMILVRNKPSVSTYSWAGLLVVYRQFVDKIGPKIVAAVAQW
jgi:hypothetical protein